jgi:phytoene synthase
MTQAVPDWHACAAIVERADAERFRAIMAAPVAARGILFTVYAFNVEVVRAPWVTAEPMIAEMRLQWWRDVLEQIQTGQDVRRHEVSTPLAAVLSQEGAAELDALVAARRWDIYKDPFEDDAQFTNYLERTSGSLLFAASSALGQADREMCRDIGYADGLARFLQAIPALEEAKRIPLLDGRSAALQALAAEGLARLARAREQRSKLVASALLTTWQAGGILRQVANEPERVGAGALGLSGFASSARLSYVAMTGRW